TGGRPAKMKRNAYFLVLLTFWAQFDDALMPPSAAVQSAPVPGDDDEYVPSGSEQQHRSLSPHRQGKAVGVQSRGADGFLVARGTYCPGDRATALLPRPLYVFMSLQI